MQNDDSEVIKSAHKQWLELNVTKSALAAIEEHKGKFIKSLIRDAFDKDVSSDQIRLLAVGLKTCDAIVVLLKTSENFKFYTINL